MKSSKLGVIIIAVVVVVAGSIFLFAHDKNPVTTVTPTQRQEASPTNVVPTTSKYSAELKAKVRSEFINDCNTKSHAGVQVCTCAADYLAKNYSETQLAEFYVQYRVSSQIPDAIKIAVSNCSEN
jgi:hypothetical protein